MRSPIAVLKSDWRQFKDDAPGDRFENQRERAHRRSPAMIIVLAMIGMIFVAGGIVLLVFPGPGIPVIVLGLALIATASRSLAKAMDRAEPALRKRWDRIKAWWKNRKSRQHA